MKSRLIKTDTYDFSVIIPTRDRSAVLAKCLEALKGQNYRKDLFEIIVSDDGSADDTKAVVENFRRQHKDITLLYVAQPNGGASAARNRAIRAAKGQLLLIINDDTICIPEVMAEHKKSHEHYPEENVAILGKMTISDEVPYSIFTQLHLDATFERFKGKTELDWKAFITCNLSIHRSFLLKFGLFDENFRVLHEDLELAERLSHHGLKLIYNPMALGYHYHFIGEKDFLSSAIQDGKSLAVWYSKSPHLRKELAEAGLYRALPFNKRFKYFIVDLIINKKTIPFFLVLARFWASRNEGIALSLYIKIFQSIKRHAFRGALS